MSQPVKASPHPNVDPAQNGLAFIPVQGDVTRYLFCPDGRSFFFALTQKRNKKSQGSGTRRPTFISLAEKIKLATLKQKFFLRQFRRVGAPPALPRPFAPGKTTVQILWQLQFIAV